MSLASPIVAGMTSRQESPMKESLEELLRRDLQAWLLAKALIEKARRNA